MLNQVLADATEVPRTIFHCSFIFSNFKIISRNNQVDNRPYPFPQHWFMTNYVSPFGSSTLYPSWHDSDLLVKFLCRFLWGPNHYGASYCIPVEASDGSASIPRNMDTPLGPLSTPCNLPLRFVSLHMSELSIRQQNLLFILCDYHRKMRFYCNNTTTF